MGMLFVLSSGGDVFTDNPQLKSYDEFADLTPEEMAYIMMVYDHASILHRMPFQRRQEKALKQLGLYDREGQLTSEGRDIKKPSKKLQKAIDFFKELLGYNPYNLVEGTEKLLEDATEIMKNGVLEAGTEAEDRLDMVDRMKVGKDVAAVLKVRQEILNVISPPDENTEAVESKKVSDSVVDQQGAQRE